MVPPETTAGLWGALCALFTLVSASSSPLDVVFAVNCGGEAHTGFRGIKYARDPLHGRVGTASDFGRHLPTIARAHPDDVALYQTERYHRGTFGYDIPADRDGDYVLVLKFSEVYFDAPDMKVFDVVLNGEHTVVADLDIYERVGKGVAHDEYVSYSVHSGRLRYEREESEIRNGKIRVDFIKGYRDNPKVNALYVIRGKVDRVAKLPPLTPPPSVPDVDSESEAEAPPTGSPERARAVPDDKASKARRPSGPKHPDPYQSDDSSYLLPVFIAIGAFVPLLFCICKL